MSFRITDDPTRFLLACGLFAILAGLQEMFSFDHVLMGWVGIGIGFYFFGLLLWRMNRKGKADT